jgi:hypothetical protein
MSESLRTARVLDLTHELRTATWTGEWRKDKQLFDDDEGIHGIDRGVYVHYLVNDHEHPVHDRNGEKRGKGKLLIHPNLGTIKFGKFEGGLIRRRSQDVLHIHRRDPRSVRADKRFPLAPYTFRECVRLALVLNLTDHCVSFVRYAERVLRDRIPDLIKRHSLKIQDYRGDYRILERTAPAGFVDELAAWARSVFDDIAGK